MSSDPSLTVSILFDREPEAALPVHEPDCFGDLHLDEIVGWLVEGRDEYELAPLLHQPLRDPDSVSYRQLVVRDLEREEVQAAVRSFAERMRSMRRCLAFVRKLHYARQKQRWLLEAVAVYCAAVGSLDEQLAGLALGSEGLCRVRDHVARLCGSASFRSLRAEVEELERRLAATHYMIHLKGLQVRVLAPEERPDVSAEVQDTFAKFAQGAVKDHRVRFNERPELNHVESQILDYVAELHRETFAALERFCTVQRGYLDTGVARFDREVQFYLAYLELITPLRNAGLAFTEPSVSRRAGAVRARATFDLALARRLVLEGADVVGNDLELGDDERVIVVSGPNNGGKTTFARTFGQLHYLASLGLPVPGSAVELQLADRIFTHFEREEDIATLRGKFEDELARIRLILAQATADSILILNETFGSTTLRDARLVGARVMEQIIELGAFCVFVTFIDELATAGDSVVSMVSTVDPDDPAVRTYKVVRRAADGLAYAAAIADKYGLGFDALRRRITS